MGAGGSREKGEEGEEVFSSTIAAAAAGDEARGNLAVVVVVENLSRLGNSLFSFLSTHLSAGVPTPFPLVGPARPGGRRQVAQAKALAGRSLRGGGGDEDDAAAGDDRRRASRRRRRRRERRAAVGRDGRQLFFFRFYVVEEIGMRVEGSVVSGLEQRKRSRVMRENAERATKIVVGGEKKQGRRREKREKERPERPIDRSRSPRRGHGVTNCSPY